MKFRGKIIGAAFGLLLGGPVGMALGFIAGHLYDMGYFHAFFNAAQGNIHTQAQQLFFNNAFKVMGYVAKSDGRVSENEIRAAQLIMSKMGLDDASKQHAIRLFSIGKESDFDVNLSLTELRRVFRLQPMLLQLFLDIQLQMATADGYLSSSKKSTLQYICDQLGIVGYQFNQYEHRHHQQKNYQHQRPQSQSDAMSLHDAYSILGVTTHSTPDEIKKAYRKLMSQNHPDKLIAKGLPPEMIKVATQKTQRIKQAYDQVKKAKSL